MPTTVVENQSVWARNQWLLPALLALLIVAIVLIFTVGPKLKSAASATATPTLTAERVVVTATPAAPTVTPGGPTVTPLPAGAAPGPATATPSSQGQSTPLPHSTPQSTVVGLRLGMITRDQNQVTTDQTGADKKDPNFSYYLDPRMVVEKTLPHYGFTSGFQISQPAQAIPTPTAFTSADGRPEIDFLVAYQAHNYKVQLVQPGKTGPTGIWVVVTIFKQP